MEDQKTEIKKGIQLHCINTNKFKTNLLAVFFTIELNRENVTKNALIPAVLRRGSKTMPTLDEISKQLEEMYGAGFNCGINKMGDNQVIKFYFESINDLFLPEENGNMLSQSIQKLFELILDPVLENGVFKKEYVEQEKNNLKQVIEGKIDQKDRYAKDRCIEEMYKGENFALYQYGYVEDLDQITETNLYEYYQQLLQTCKIDIFVSGQLEEDVVTEIKENENVQKLQERDPYYQVPKMEKKEPKEEKVVTESMEVTQGKLILGLDVDVTTENANYDIMVYNSILGGSANSKLFQNVREKASLAYTAGSSYLRYKNNILIQSGIEIENYEKALEIITKQMEDMKNGDFTDEELENAKKGILASILAIADEQDTQITYYFGQEISQTNASIEQYQKNVEQVTREKVIAIANQVKINTIYFLKD